MDAQWFCGTWMSAILDFDFILQWSRYWVCLVLAGSGSRSGCFIYGQSVLPAKKSSAKVSSCVAAGQYTYVGVFGSGGQHSIVGVGVFRKMAESSFPAGLYHCTGDLREKRLCRGCVTGTAGCCGAIFTG